MREVRADGLSDHIRCRLELGFALPPLDTMQNYQRLKFLDDCIERFAPSTGVGLEIGCYKCTSTVFIAHACARAQVSQVYAIDLFTGARSWNTKVDYLDEAQHKLARYGLNDRVTLIRSDSLCYSWTAPIAALHIDADHAYEAVWNDIQKYTPFIVENGICVFDDYDVTHPGVTRAVHRLLAEDSSSTSSPPIIRAPNSAACASAGRDGRVTPSSFRGEILRYRGWSSCWRSCTAFS
jgi:predicted O-methyltransferase YrrM